MNIEQLQKSYPRWNFYIDIDNSNIHITSKYFNWLHPYVINVTKIDISQDVYDSIDYVIEFLLANNFTYDKCPKQSSGFYKPSCYVQIDLNRYLLNNRGYTYCSSNDLISKLKKIFDIVTPFKKVQLE